MALPQSAILLRCLSFDCNFQLFPSQADIARCYKSQHRWGLMKRAEENFWDMSHYPLQNMTKLQFYPQCNLKNYSETKFSAEKRQCIILCISCSKSNKYWQNMDSFQRPTHFFIKILFYIWVEAWYAALVQLVFFIKRSKMVLNKQFRLATSQTFHHFPHKICVLSFLNCSTPRGIWLSPFKEGNDRNAPTKDSCSISTIYENLPFI